MSISLSKLYTCQRFHQHAQNVKGNLNILFIGVIGQRLQVILDVELVSRKKLMINNIITLKIRYYCQLLWNQLEKSIWGKIFNQPILKLFKCHINLDVTLVVIVLVKLVNKDIFVLGVVASQTTEEIMLIFAMSALINIWLEMQILKTA